MTSNEAEIIKKNHEIWRAVQKTLYQEFREKNSLTFKKNQTNEKFREIEKYLPEVVVEYIVEDAASFDFADSDNVVASNEHWEVH